MEKISDKTKFKVLFDKFSEFKNVHNKEIELLNNILAQLDSENGVEILSRELNKSHLDEIKKHYENDILSYQTWIGELGKIFVDSLEELNHYKARCFSQVDKISYLSNDLNKREKIIRELNERTEHFSLLKKELNQLYNLFYLIEDQKKELNKLGYVQVRSRIKKLFLRSRFLAKASFLLNAAMSFKFKTYLRNTRLFKRYDWEVEYIKSTGTFDYHYYLSKYPDIKVANVDPVRHYVMHGYREGRNPNALFDSEAYLKMYEDIRVAGINPYLHYLQKGINEMRRPNPGFDVNQLNVFLEGNNYIEAFAKCLYSLSVKHEGELVWNTGQLESSREGQYQLRQIVFVSGLFHNTSHQFRVVDQVNILKELNYNVSVITFDSIEENEHLLVFSEVIVLFRVGWSEKLEKIVAKCREAGVVIVYDTDDYVFDPSIANESNVDGIRFLADKDKKLYHEGVLLYQKAAGMSDLGVFTTPRLASSYQQYYDKKSFIIKNGFSDYFFETSIDALKKRTKSGSTIIGYASGSLTHQKDFKVASKGLARVLAKHKNCKLRIVGMINVDEFPELLEYKDQIETRPVAAHPVLPYELAEFDINLAPLEIDNPFCEAKSDLKYFEAALVCVPTVASATEPYRMAIKDGETGYLAYNDDDWFNYLDKLVSDHSHRLRMANDAYSDTLDRYSYSGKKKEVKTAFDKIYLFRKELLDKNKFKKTISFVLPEMVRGSGGHAKAISVARLLTRFDHTVTLNFIGNHTDYLNPQMIEKEFHLDTTRIRVVYTDTVSYDSNIIVATFWKTVYYIENSKNRFGEKFHFMQDYEPYFYSMGTDYLLAVNAMKKDLKKISYGLWVKEIVKIKHGISAESMSFYYNKDIYYDDDIPNQRKNAIVFFARPEMPRRCFDLGLKALQLYRKKYGNSSEIIIFGSYAVENVNIGFEHINLNVRSPFELAALYRSARLGIAFSPTNPSMVPFEMMACGLPVLDLDVEGNEYNYGGRDNVFLVSPDENEIADKIHELLNDHIRREAVAERGKRFIHGLPREEDAIYELEKILTDGK